MLDFFAALIVLVIAIALSHGFDWGLFFGLIAGLLILSHKLIYNIILIHVRKSVNGKRK